jgi:hypothetical protein
VVITSGLLRALQGRGIEEIIEARCNGRSVIAHKYSGGFGAGNLSTIDGETNADVLFPQIDFLTNDAWSLVRAEANGNGFPLLLMDRYSKGILYVWTMPENFNDLYALPPQVVTTIKSYLMRVDGPGQVALFAYDNNTFIVESYLPAETGVQISVAGTATKLKNLVTGETISGTLPPSTRRNWQNNPAEERVSFTTKLLPHSYAVFGVEK